MIWTLSMNSTSHSFHECWIEWEFVANLSSVADVDGPNNLDLTSQIETL